MLKKALKRKPDKYEKLLLQAAQRCVLRSGSGLEVNLDELLALYPDRSCASRLSKRIKRLQRVSRTIPSKNAALREKRRAEIEALGKELEEGLAPIREFERELMTRAQLLKDKHVVIGWDSAPQPWPDGISFTSWWIEPKRHLLEHVAQCLQCRKPFVPKREQVIWGQRETGTLANVYRLVEGGKDVVVYSVPAREFAALKTREDWNKFLDRCGPEVRDQLEKRLKPDGAHGLAVESRPVSSSPTRRRAPPGRRNGCSPIPMGR